MSVNKEKLSAVIITLNEEKKIGTTLEALKFCDEIVVVDSGSTDSTVEICTRCGCRVFNRVFDGYGPQKQYAIDQTLYEWVFVVDADEIVSPELREEIGSVLATGRGRFDGFDIPITLIFLGRVMRFGEYKRPHFRLFRKSAGSFNNNRVHEQVVFKGRKGRLRNHILHYSYDSITDYFNKFNAYTSASAVDLLKKGRKRHELNVGSRFPLTFFKLYVLKGCWRCGYEGFLWSMFSSFYSVVKFAKMRELKNETGMPCMRLLP